MRSDVLVPEWIAKHHRVRRAPFRLMVRAEKLGNWTAEKKWFHVPPVRASSVPQRCEHIGFRAGFVRYRRARRLLFDIGETSLADPEDKVPSKIGINAREF